MPCPFFSAFHDNVLQDIVVIVEKIDSNLLNHYDFEYITTSPTYSNIIVKFREKWNFKCMLSTVLEK